MCVGICVYVGIHTYREIWSLCTHKLRRGDTLVGILLHVFKSRSQYGILRNSNTHHIRTHTELTTTLLRKLYTCVCNACVDVCVHLKEQGLTLVVDIWLQSVASVFYLNMWAKISWALECLPRLLFLFPVHSLLDLMNMFESKGLRNRFLRHNCIAYVHACTHILRLTATVFVI